MSAKRSNQPALSGIPNRASNRPGDRAILEGTVARISFQNPQGRYTVARLHTQGLTEVTAVGEIFPLSEGEEIRVAGHWKMHPRYGIQLQAEQWEKLEPATREGIEKYFGSGLIKGIGPVPHNAWFPPWV